MARKIFRYFFLFTICCLLFAKVIYAQVPPLGVIPTSPYACDLCGKCEGSLDPPDYTECYGCIYDANGKVKPGFSWTVVGCVSTTPGGFTQTIVKIVTGIAGGIAFLVFLNGSFKVLTSAGDVEKLTSGKSLIVSSIVATILIIFSVFIFNFIAVNILKLPGFGG